MNRGFTVLELLIVIAVMGLLSNVVYANVSSSRATARDAIRMSDMKSIQKSLELYYNDFGQYPSTGVGMAGVPSTWANCSSVSIGGHPATGTNAWIPGLAPDYISALPDDPKPDLGNSCFNYRYKSNGRDYKLAAFRTAEVFCPTSDNIWYDLSSNPAWCVLTIYTPGARLWAF